MIGAKLNFPDESEVAVRFIETISPLDFSPFPDLRRQAFSLMTQEGMKAKYNAVRGHLLNVPTLGESTGLDIGCGYGLPVYLMRVMGAGRLYGCDVLSERISGANYWLRLTGLPNVRFETNSAGELPFADGMFDWATAIGLYANLNREASTQLLLNARRVLRPGGLFLLNESTNPRYPPVRTAIEARYRDEEKPGGMLFEERREFIRARAPDLSDTALADLTERTCYMWGAGLQDAIDEFRQTGVFPEFLFNPDDLMRPPMRANSGNVVMRPCDPSALRRELEACGFSVRFRTPAADRFIDDGEIDSYFCKAGGVFVVAEAVV